MQRCGREVWGDGSARLAHNVLTFIQHSPAASKINYADHQLYFCLWARPLERNWHASRL